MYAQMGITHIVRYYNSTIEKHKYALGMGDVYWAVSNNSERLTVIYLGS